MFNKFLDKIYEMRFARYGKLIEVYTSRMAKCRENNDFDKWRRLCDRNLRLLKKRTRILTKLLKIRGV